MPTFLVAFRNKADNSIVEVHVTAATALEALRILREKYPASSYSPVFITPSRTKGPPAGTKGDPDRGSSTR
jgi:hypothetical protein